MLGVRLMGLQSCSWRRFRYAFSHALGWDGLGVCREPENVRMRGEVECEDEVEVMSKTCGGGGDASARTQEMLTRQDYWPILPSNAHQYISES